MKTKEIVSTIRVYVIVGAASAAGSALLTNALVNKFLEAKERITRSKKK